MPNPNENQEPDGLKAIFVGLFLISLIATVTIFKSNIGTKFTAKNKAETELTESIDPKKIGKITPEELAKKIQTNSELLLVDLRNENQYTAEHIIDSINIPLSNINSFSQIITKNKSCVLIQSSQDTAEINYVSNILFDKGYKNIFYLEGGFEAWKNKFNPTISAGDQKSFTDQAKVTYVDSDELKKLLETEKNLVIIDVRENSEFMTGHLAGAINLPLDELEKKRKSIPLGKKIVLYENTSLGAFKAAVRLFDLGLSNVLTLSDGLDSWKKKNYEIVK